MRILLLEDEVFLREEVAYYLEASGHEVLQAGSIEEFWPLSGQAHIAILDIQLPDGSGFDVMTALRSRSPHIGIIMMTAQGSAQWRLSGLEGGADHYMVKPVNLRELGATIQALSRRLTPGWNLSQHNHELITPDGHHFALNTAEYALLLVICQSPGLTAEKRAIVEAMGHDWRSYDLRRLDTLTSRLRQRWAATVSEIDLPLRTERNIGYRFSEPLSLV